MAHSGRWLPDEGRFDDAELDRAAEPPRAPGRRPLTVGLAARLQRAPAPGGGAAPAPAAGAGGAAAAPAAAATDAVIVDDGADVQPGQMPRTQFLNQLREQVIGAANDALGPVWSAVGCPYIETWFGRNAATPAADLERLARRYSGVAAPRAASEYIPPILARLRDGIARWKAGENVGADAAAAGLGIAPQPAAPAAAQPAAAPAPAPADGGGAVQLKSDGSAMTRGGAEPGSPAALLDELGAGSALDASHGGRIGAAMGDDFGDVRVHTDAGAARKASELGARAFTVGNHVAFAAGEYRPGSPEGDALLAHELAHVQQQRGGAIDAAARKKAEVEGPEGPLEREADQVAAAAVTQLHQQGTPATARAKSSLNSTLSLKRCNNNTPAPASTASPPVPVAPIPTSHGADQHAGAFEPNAAQQGGIYGHLNPNAVSTTPAAPPTTTGSPTPAPVVKVETWDGNDPDPVKRADNRKKQVAALKKEMRTYLDGFTAHIAKMKTAKRVPMTQAGTGALAGKDTGVQGIAALANGLVNSTFGATMAAAASTSAMTGGRTTPLNATPPKKPGDPKQSLVDGNDVTQHAAALGNTIPEMARGTAWWIATSTNKCEKILRDHKWDPSRGGDESTVFDGVLTDFLATGSNQADVVDYEVFGLNAAGPDNTVILLTAIDPDAAPGGDVAKAEKAARWDIFDTAVHETLHLRAHPNFNSAIGSKQVMREGFCEVFTEEAVNPLWPTLASGGNEPLRQGVEGKADPLDPSVIPKKHVVPGQYKNFYDHAIAVRDGGGGSTAVGVNGMKAAFFHGHVELLGLNPDGTQVATPPAAGAPKLAVPAGVSNVDQLAAASGVGKAQLVTDNPGIEATFPAAAVMTGCRSHLVVQATDASGTVVEGRAQIAAQNGVSEADLVRANPGIPVDKATNQWPALKAGDRVLIPKH